MFGSSTLKWLSIGIGVKRWVLLMIVGNLLMAVGFTLGVLLARAEISHVSWPIILTVLMTGMVMATFSLLRLSLNLLAPYRQHRHDRVIDVVYSHSRRQRGLKIVVIGGGTGLPSVLRGLKAYTSNLAAVVTVADDGGSSGRLRRDLGVLPPGDIRNNIVALADDESLMTKLFQYRFEDGDLGGHAFGNLFIAALTGVSGSLEIALTEVGRVLNIQGRVLPATLDDVNLQATIRQRGKNHALRVVGESRISAINGQIESINIVPEDAAAFSQSVRAIRQANIVVIGPGSLYTSILPNLLVKGIADALRETQAIKVYVCNVATQPGETDGYNVADHIVALERHIGRGVFGIVVANNAYPAANENTHYVRPIPEGHDAHQRYQVIYTDLTDPERPWRHDPQKLANTLLRLYDGEQVGGASSVSPLIDGIQEERMLHGN